MTATIQQGASPATGPDRPPPPVGRQQSTETLLAETHRGIVPIRKIFVQQGHGRTTRPGPLATFLRSHDDRGLEAYLFLHAMASASAPYNCVLSSGVWVRVLGLAQNAELHSARGAVSKIMKRLVDRNLIERSRTGRRSDLTLLREDGSGTKYERPLGETKFDRWLQLPHAYWLEGHYTDLSLPAKVILLIALSRDDGFSLPQDRAFQWYGISADSADEGLRELVNKDVLYREYRWEADSRSDTGWTKRYTYTPVGSFSKASVRRPPRVGGPSKPSKTASSISTRSNMRRESHVGGHHQHGNSHSGSGSRRRGVHLPGTRHHRDGGRLAAPRR